MTQGRRSIKVSIGNVETIIWCNDIVIVDDKVHQIKAKDPVCLNIGQPKDRIARNHDRVHVIQIDARLACAGDDVVGDDISSIAVRIQPVQIDSLVATGDHIIGDGDERSIESGREFCRVGIRSAHPTGIESEGRGDVDDTAVDKAMVCAIDDFYPPGIRCSRAVEGKVFDRHISGSVK